MSSITLSNKTALVTGGSRGIGAGIAKRLAKEGANVVITYAQSSDLAQGVVDEIRAGGGNAQAIRADSALADEAVGAVTTAVELFGGLDILVNNAGVAALDPLDVATHEEIQRMIDINVRAVILTTREALRYLPSGGRIINIGSVNADRMPLPGGSPYSMTKGAVAGFTRGLARELAPKNITVNNVQPGPVDTDLNPMTGPWADNMLAHLAEPRFGTVEEIASLVAYLAGPEATFMTGSSVTIDGGFGA